jgi:hypothetical protein
LVILRQDIAESNSRFVTGEESSDRSQGRVEITANVENVAMGTEL